MAEGDARNAVLRDRDEVGPGPLQAVGQEKGRPSRGRHRTSVWRAQRGAGPGQPRKLLGREVVQAGAEVPGLFLADASPTPPVPAVGAPRRRSPSLLTSATQRGRARGGGDGDSRDPAAPASPRVSAQEGQQLLSSPTEELAKLPGESQSTNGLTHPPAGGETAKTGDPLLGGLCDDPGSFHLERQLQLWPADPTPRASLALSSQALMGKCPELTLGAGPPASCPRVCPSHLPWL